MALAHGTRLGVYEITAALGEGGMGQVFRARDTKLNRDVALKVLPDSFATDPDRLARFTREAQMVAALNHPNIAHLHGLEESGGITALVMELVEGDDLSQRIARGPIPLDEVLPIAKQIAEALEAAHEQGIVHRDLKPANIKVRSDGTVKVLDFGLAKAVDAGEVGRTGGNTLTPSPMITTPAMTAAGMILGTAAYMSPEQARGRPVDRRMTSGRAVSPDGQNIVFVAGSNAGYQIWVRPVAALAARPIPGAEGGCECRKDRFVDHYFPNVPDTIGQFSGEPQALFQSRPPSVRRRAGVSYLLLVAVQLTTTVSGATLGRSGDAVDRNRFPSLAN